ncbi:MAG: alpha-L-rhamnosidase C-terminal domain-containing protein [Bacteroidota bacterium]
MKSGYVPGRIPGLLIIVFLLFILDACRQSPVSTWIFAAKNNNDYSVLYFRKKIEINTVPEAMHINISATQRYKLFVNGHFVGLGPQISDPEHWKYDSYNVSDYLNEGDNIFAVEVINFGDFAGSNMFSSQTGLWIESPTLPQINSSEEWKFMENSNHHPVRIKNTVHVRGGFLAPACDSVIFEEETRDWYSVDYDDSNWKNALAMETQSAEPSPRTIPFLERKTERFKRILRGGGEAENFSFTDTSFSFRVESQSKLTLLLDNGVLTTGFPEIIFSGGRKAGIKISYAEALYYPDQKDDKGKLIGEAQGKGNRNETKGKEFIGYYDFIRPDGSRKEIFRPTWFRTYRYILLEIVTGESPLIIEDFYGVFTAYPFKQKAEFESSDSVLNEMWSVAWRTAQLCAWETYMDCPYYEQLQYVGDTRIQALVSLYNTGDTRLMENAIEQFAWSIDSTGLTHSAYPASSGSIIPPFSLFWTMMLDDYYNYTGDIDFVKTYLDKVKGIFDWHLNYMDPEMKVLKDLDFWNFVDWPDEWAWDPVLNTGGMPEGVREGGISSILNLQYVYAIQKFEGIFRETGEIKAAESYLKIANNISQSIKQLCWDENANLLKDSFNGNDYSQHANLLAVLTGLIPEEESGEFIERISFDQDLIRTTIYYRFYLFEALRKAGMEHLYYDLLGSWRKMLERGLTTFAERHDPTRSDCHAWSASPNYHFLTLICGVEPSNPGFREVAIKPSPGALEWINASVAHPEGKINFYYTSVPRDSFSITLPEKITGNFEFHGKNIELTGGKNILTNF